MPPTPFEAGKSAKELGIDISRAFICVEDGNFKIGSILKIDNDDGSIDPWFIDEYGHMGFMDWKNLAYYEPTPKVKEEYAPQVGDRVSLEGEIKHVFPGNESVNILFKGGHMEYQMHKNDGELSNFTLLSRPTPKREMTLKQIEDELGFEVKIVE